MNLLRKGALAPTPHEAAARWLGREESGAMSAGERAELRRWIDADPDHATAWADVRAATAIAADNAADPRLMEMRAAALRARPDPRFPVRPAVAAAWATVVLAGGALFWTSAHKDFRETISSTGVGEPAAVQQRDAGAAVYRTAVGERAAIRLSDGSLATLDTDSAMQIAYTAKERGVRLLYGQALFEVAKHKPIPFQVYAGNQRITAVGTRFNVRLGGSRTDPSLRVVLLEGVVKVTRLTHETARAAAPSVTMAPGEMLETRADTPLRVASADVEGLTSWRTGMLTFNDASLGSAVAEMNRYAARPITLADPSLAALRISGVFKSGESERFAQDVAEALPVTVSRGPNGGPMLVARQADH